MKELKINDKLSIEWLGHSGFLIRSSGKNIFVDPFQINTNEKADLIFITHHHYDHYSVTDIQKIFTKNTKLILLENCLDKIKENPVIDEDNIILTNIGFKGIIEGVGVETVPAYNINKQFHPKGNEWAGYILDFNGVKIYHSGDTDLIPEMKDFRCDIALLAVGGNYTMDAKEAAKACELINPKMYAIPMHYNSVVGTKEAAEEFEELSNCMTKRLD